jgi:hypothetical protein
MAGFHEVIITPDTIATIKRREAAKESLWRVSSTCFGHIQSDQVLEPLPPFKNQETEANYPPMKAGHQVQAELQAISLLKE